MMDIIHHKTKETVRLRTGEWYDLNNPIDLEALVGIAAIELTGNPYAAGDIENPEAKYIGFETFEVSWEWRY